MAKAQSNKTTTGVKHPTLGFGVPASSDPHHFKVIIPKSSTGKVQISEYLGLQAQSEEFSVVDRVQLDRTRWTAIRAEVQRAFNARLKSYGLETSSWQVGENMLDRLLGKEICVLAWAIEGMEIDNIPVAVRNWLALSPEERWWLFGMTAKSTGGVEDRDVGWRIALRHALGDIVQTEQIQFTQDSSVSYSRYIPKSHEIKEPSVSYGDLKSSDDACMLSHDTGGDDSLSLDASNAQLSIEPALDNSNVEEFLFLFEAKLAKAIGQPVGEMSSPEFLVKKGSTANIAQAKSLRPAIRELRQKLLDEGVLVNQGDVYSFVHEYQFKSPSAAACVIAGNPRSGMDAWRDLQGRSLKELGYGKKI
ncbi:DUF3780 and DUF4357 domain-containing protein [Enterobacter sp. E12]|uniref:anti-phage-associated DUF3780 domain-containing protein n=1 Tax=Enterobacteriaceae TaxID=543 RepID=UPI000C80BEBF|nr:MULTISPECIES: anti-phage-associated DUF3780 domain-containing protein [Enterobacteriaceae]MBD0816447.1 DUF3780 and DUF4357 domain-containing protein [Enterobacter sp. E12]PMD76487.1 hypothetical protein A8A10_21895 [Klebsiella pneumoniae]HBX9967585.1 DUF3780 and DUF4357 domain-containing protein [Klebsiella variicola]HBX9972891.1 DUF3780 and DUF4357 domain-containing protein [Klebsiella variicola]